MDPRCISEFFCHGFETRRYNQIDSRRAMMSVAPAAIAKAAVQLVVATTRKCFWWADAVTAARTKTLTSTSFFGMCIFDSFPRCKEFVSVRARRGPISGC